MRVLHAYHCYARGHWQDPLAEHLWALDRGGFDGPTILGLVGPAADRDHVRAVWHAVYPDAQTVEADAGYEQVTLAAVAAHAADHDGAVLYAHTKGAGWPSDAQQRWRRSMTSQVVTGWRRAVTALDAHDAAGCHWLTPKDLQAAGFPATVGAHFAGNFWTARCDYLRRLPACSTADRFQAEQWIGLAEPRIHDLLPGWPHESGRVPLGVGRLIVPIKGGSRCG